MAYTKQTWTDRVVQFARRFTKVDDGTYLTLTPSPGTVTQVGSIPDASKLNYMEQGIKDAHDLIANLDQSKAPLASPTFTGDVTLPQTNNYSTPTATNEKVGRETMSGTSKVVTDAFVTTATSITIIPLSTPAGILSATMGSGTFTVSSTASETITFVWVGVK